MSYIKNALRAEVAEFLEQTGMAPTRLGLEALSNRNFHDRLQDDSDLMVSTVERVRKYMDGKRREIAARKGGA